MEQSTSKYRSGLGIGKQIWFGQTAIAFFRVSCAPRLCKNLHAGTNSIDVCTICYHSVDRSSVNLSLGKTIRVKFLQNNSKSKKKHVFFVLSIKLHVYNVNEHAIKIVRLEYRYIFFSYQDARYFLSFSAKNSRVYCRNRDACVIMPSRSSSVCWI